MQIQNISDEELLKAILQVSFRLINNRLYCKYFVLDNLIYDDEYKQYKIKDRRSIRAMSYYLEYNDHPDLIDDVDTFYGKMSRNLERNNKRYLYDIILTKTIEYLYKNKKID